MSIFTQPVVGNNFFAREDILESLLKSAKSIREGYRHNIAIVGRGLIGKSSLLLHFLGKVKDYDGLVPVYVNLKETTLEDFIRNYIAMLLYHSLKKVKKLDEMGDLDTLLALGEKTFPETSDLARRITGLLDDKEYNEAFSETLNLNTILSAESGACVVVVLDEFSGLSDLKLKKPFQVLGQKIMVQQKTLFILSSSSTINARKILSEKLSLLFGGFDIIDIDAFSPIQAREFVRIQTIGISISEDLIDFIITFTGGHPFYLSSIINNINSAKRYGVSRIAQRRLSEIIAELLFNPSGAINQFFSSVLDQIKTILPEGEAFDILKAMLQTGRTADITQKYTAVATELTNLLSLLLELGLVSKSGALHAITDNAFKVWIEIKLKPKNLCFDFIPQEETTDFIKEIDLRISEFIGQKRRNIDERIVELLTSFNNERFFIDERVRMLPNLSFLHQKSLNPDNTLVVTRGKKKWIFILTKKNVNEEDVDEILKGLKSYLRSKPKLILIATSGIDDSAKVVAKQKKIWVWNKKEMSRLFKFYKGYNALIA